MQTQTINISLSKQFIKIIDNLAKEEYSSRSDLIRNALISYIEKKHAGKIYLLMPKI